MVTLHHITKFLTGKQEDHQNSLRAIIIEAYI